MLGADEGEAQARRSRSLARLKQRGIGPVEAPLSPSEASVEPRSKAAIARRLYALLYVARAGVEGRRSGGKYGRIARDALFTPAEQAFLDTPRGSAALQVRFAWRSEAALPLFWALGYVREMLWPENRVHADEFYDYLVKTDFIAFVAGAEVRSTAQLLDEADLMICLDTPGPSPETATQIVSERRLALAWLTPGVGPAEWDGLETGWSRVR